MFLRWIHKTWKFLWRLVLTVLLLVVVVCAAVMGILQMEVAQDYLGDRLEQQVEQRYEADLSIGDIRGVLPFSLGVEGVTLTREGHSGVDTLATVDYLEGEIDIWSLLQNRINITAFSLEQPRIWLRTNEQGHLQFLPSAEGNGVAETGADERNRFRNTEFFAPAIQVSDGELYLEDIPQTSQTLDLPSHFSFSNINTSLFFEWSDEQRFLDVEVFTAEVQGLQIETFSFSGQVYSEENQLEINSFDFMLGDSPLSVNGEIQDVRINESNFLSQLSEAHYNLQAGSSGLDARQLAHHLKGFPAVEKPLFFELHVEGPLNALNIHPSFIGIGESVAEIEGSLQNLQDPATLVYELEVQSESFITEDLRQLMGGDTMWANSLDSFSFNAQATGNADSLSTDLTVSGSPGRLHVTGGSQLRAPYQYEGTMTGENINLHHIVPEDIDTSSLNFDARFSGAGFTLQEAFSEVEASFTSSQFNGITFDQLYISSFLEDGLWRQDYTYFNGDEKLTGSGRINLARERPPLTIKGNAENINLARLFRDSVIADTKLNFAYNVEARGVKADNIYGRANLDIQPSVINNDTVRAHQLYMDLSPPGQEERSFRLTSSLFDLNVSGQLVPSTLSKQAGYWGGYLATRFQSEILLNAPADTIQNEQQPVETTIMNGTITTKDLGLIHNYFPDFPEIKADSDFKFDINANGNRLLLSAEMQVDSLQYEEWRVGNGSTHLTASFRGDRSLKEFATVDFAADIETVNAGGVDFESVGVNTSLKQDSLYYNQQIGSISDDARFYLTLNSALSDTSINVAVSSFFLGNNEYAWINRQSPSLTFRQNGAVDLENFRFQNKSEYFEMSGTMSADRQDSLVYDINNVHLDRISSLINGEISFGGILNGTLVTKSLTQQPTIQGELSARRFTLNDRIVGDITFDSQYNPQLDRFDTGIGVSTDPRRYEDYLEENDDIGQNMQLDGYFVTPRPNARQDTVFYFDADFEQIDMWVIPLIVDNIFEEMEGYSTGEGYVTGNLEDFDFHADFQTHNVFAKPRFVETNYFVNGPVELDRDEGVTFDSLTVMDTKGGTGTVWGNIDLNDFSPITYLDLSADLRQLQFLNSTFDPDIPFYGNVSGTGLVRLTGSNTDMFLRTADPLRLSSDSDVSIPLMEQTELSESGRFIRFVDSFENRDQRTSIDENTAVSDENLSEEELSEEIREMTFSERFDLDLRFTSNNDVTVRLIFDPVTGEILTSQGTGQLRLTMQDQDVQMFGRYTIDSGNYQFVTGEIISRRLELESGGTIVWEGEPDNARLDISAVYNARPNISTLMAERPVETQNQSGQQVPIDLIVEINGTLNSVENNYFFRLPPSLDLSSSSTLTYTINEINRDEQQKLLQATSILFTGQFIPTQGANNATATLGENLRKGSTLLNPLLSNQVISPLLSNQINALLNSDVTRFDVDFNLNAYNEVDLGIALRLYNDRLVLRREGQITGGGPQSTLGDRIGDINATYRIQQGLSLTAFHRQDQILGSYGASGAQAGDVTPSVDGLGFEAQVQFNDWKGLLNKISNMFGSNQKDPEDQNESDLVKQKAVEEK